MIHIASKATHGVQIPNQKQTQDEIIMIFKTQMNKLKERLNVSIWPSLGHIPLLITALNPE